MITYFEPPPSHDARLYQYVTGLLNHSIIANIPKIKSAAYFLRLDTNNAILAGTSFQLPLPILPLAFSAIRSSCPPCENSGNDCEICRMCRWKNPLF